MKLFSRYNRINILFTVAIFIIGSISFSLLIHYVVNNQIDEDLVTEKDEIIAYAKLYQHLPAIEDVHDQYTSYKSIKPLREHGVRFYSQTLWDAGDHEHEPVRSIEWDMQAGGKWYLVTVSESLDVIEDLIQSIIIITIALILLILLAGLLINRLVLRRLWQPFYNTINVVRQFKLKETKQIELSSSSIDEFNLMNTTLKEALNKAQQDYKILKEFTENASHELQTPLAIISSKLDLMLQSEDLTEAQSQVIEGTHDAIKRLKNVNQSLLLLAKIENRQFVEQASIDLHSLLIEKQKQFVEQWEGRHIEMRINASGSVINGSPQLIDILLNNLFSNAIWHNVTGGFIMIKLQPQQLAISNSGEAKPLDERYLFNRFYKANSGSVKNGLGLSIVKQICDVSGYTCIYQFKLPNEHAFTLNWR